MTPRCRGLAIALGGLLGLVGLAATARAADEQVWPSEPAEPVLRWESAVRSLAGYEIAVQGPAAEAPRAGQKLKRPSGLAFDQRGRLLVSDSRQGLLLRIDSDLGVALVFGAGTEPRLREPMGVTVHPNGTILVADSGLQQVVAFDEQGEIVAVYGAGSLDEPFDVAISPNGRRIHVADASGDRVAVFDFESGRELESLGRRGKGVAEFYLPTAVEFDNAGNLMVVDQVNSRVQFFDASGAFTRALYSDRATGFSRPRDVAVDGAGRVYLTDSAQSRVQVYDTELEPLFSIGRNGMGDGEFLGVGAIAVRGERLAVLDRAGGRVQIFEVLGVGAVEKPRVATPGAAVAVEPARRGPAEEAAAEMPVPGEPPAAAEPEPAASPLEQPAYEEPMDSEPMAEEPLDEPTAERADPEPRKPSTAPVPVPTPDRPEDELVEIVNGWAAAWAAQEPERYLSYYASSFAPADGTTREAWAARRRERLSAPSSIEVTVEIEEARAGIEEAEVTFVQSYASDRFSDRVRKSLRFVREGGGWKIARETVLETL